MIASKNIEKIVSVIVALAVVLCCAAMGFSEKLAALTGDTGVSVEYQTRLFDVSAPITVNILMDEADWQDMLRTASSEVYHKCNVEIAGKTFYEVGIRPKGNTSLSAIAANPARIGSATDRFSFKLEFDQYIDDQTCFGLDKLVLNNNYADATNMKEALIYDMYRYLGADASLYNYAEVRVNGEYWGVYLALEAVEDSFLLRNYGASMGKLYKPDSMDMGDMDKNFDPDAMPQPAQNGSGMPADDGGFGPSSGAPAGDNGFGPSSGAPSGDNGFGPGSGASGGQDAQMPGDAPSPGGFGGFSMGGNGANLNYTDDELDSYSAIWDGAVTKTKKADRRRVVNALKNIASGTELETYMDIDNLLRYMAVHVFSVNSDSLTGNMAHNYYLHEKDGRLNLIPWDYNLSLGGMVGGSDASGVINSPIDGAFIGTKFFDTLMECPEYAEGYHAYLARLVAEYVNGGGLDAFYTRTRGILDPLVQSDPTAFYTYEEYTDAAETLLQVVKLRGQSISGQLDGSIPSTQSGQRQNSTGLVDTGNLDLSIMGTMNMDNGGMGGGGGFKGFGGGFRFSPQPSDAPADENAPGGMPSASASQPANAPASGGMPEGFDPSRFGGNAPGNADASGFGPSSGGSSAPNAEAPAAAMPGNPDASGFGPSSGASASPSAEAPAAAPAQTEPTASEASEPAAQPNAAPPGFPGQARASASDVRTEALTLYGASFAVLLVGLAFAALFKRRSKAR